MVWYLVLIFAAAASGKVYNRCELARELKYQRGAPGYQVATWVCIAEHESQYNTSAVGHVNGDGSEDHGIFQINDRYWCSPPGQGRACGLTCAELEDDDISDDFVCAEKIFKEHEILSGDGFNAWAVYRPFCKGSKADRYIRGCFNRPEAPSTDISTTPSVVAHGFFGTVSKGVYTSTERSLFDAFFTPTSTVNPYTSSPFIENLTPRTSFVSTTSRPTSRLINPTSSVVPTSTVSPRVFFTPSTSRFSVFTPTTRRTVYQSSTVNTFVDEPVFIINGVVWG